MPDTETHDAWSAGESYELYMGRWSHRIAERFLDWLAAPVDAEWLDVGCGPGALTRAILRDRRPQSVLGVDPSQEFVGHARRTVVDNRARFEVGRAEALPLADETVDVVASGLMLNFVPDREMALREALRVVRPGGMVSFYVWDYPSGGIGFIDRFWKTAMKFDSAAAALDEAGRFPFCTRDGLATLCTSVATSDPDIALIEIETTFPTFDDFWRPFTLGAGPAPGYVATLDDRARSNLEAALRAGLGDGPIDLTARAWAVRSARE
jgi:SAM-dependent methyltransferase